MRGWGALARWAPFFDDGGKDPTTWDGAPNGTYGPLGPAVSGVTYDGNGYVTGFTDAAGNVYSTITRDPTTHLVTSLVVNGTTHTVTRNGSNQVTGIN